MSRYSSDRILPISGLWAASLILFSLASGYIGYETALRRGLAQPEKEKTRFGTPNDFRKAIDELRRTFPEEGTVLTDPTNLRSHGFSPYDHHPAIPHTAIVRPKSTEDVVKIVKIAVKYRMPIIPYAGATSLEGNFTSTEIGGVCVDLNRMNRIIEIHEEDSDLVCQPAARWNEINDILKEKGIPLFFPLDPGIGATLGGMLSTGCSGTNAVRYGTAKAEWFLNATVVLPNGEVIKTRRRSRKSSAGFDTTKLFIGAEGTLGIVTEVTIRLAPILPTTVAIVHFPDARLATQASIEVMNRGIGIQCLELVDDVFMKAANNYEKREKKWPEKDSLFFKFQGPSDASLTETGVIVKGIAEKYGGFDFRFALDEKEAEDIWASRKSALYAGLSLLKGSKGWITDVCVPVSKLPDLIYKTKEDLAQVGLISSIVGHAGDGNFHALILYGSEEEEELAKQAGHRMVARAIELDGTCTGEHGIGIGKIEYLVEELGEGTVRLMKTIKTAIDPLGLFNPGKLYPDLQ